MIDFPMHERPETKTLERALFEVKKVIVGQDRMIERMLVAVLARGHCLIEGVPGVAKTLLVKAVAAALDLEFRRVQFTPDLMPSDVTGNLVYESGTQQFRFRPGPVFANLLLADELNRTPPKTQAALLEAMEERQVSVEGRAEALPDPFVVIATENPIEFEGTYPLPEAELDRFLFKIAVGYPHRDAERAVLRMHDQGLDPHDLAALGVEPVAGAADIEAGAREVADVRFTDELLDYVLALAQETRTSPALALGVSPRGAAMLVRASKASAWLAGRAFVTPDDVKASMRPAWRHRLVLRPEVELEGASADSVLASVADRVPVPG